MQSGCNMCTESSFKKMFNRFLWAASTFITTTIPLCLWFFCLHRQTPLLSPNEWPTATPFAWNLVRWGFSDRGETGAWTYRRLALTHQKKREKAKKNNTFFKWFTQTRHAFLWASSWCDLIQIYLTTFFRSSSVPFLSWWAPTCHHAKDFSKNVQAVSGLKLA